MCFYFAQGGYIQHTQTTLRDQNHQNGLLKAMDDLKILHPKRQHPLVPPKRKTGKNQKSESSQLESFQSLFNISQLEFRYSRPTIIRKKKQNQHE